MSAAHTGTDAASPERLAGVDLNLIVAFDALAHERNVTRAAHRVGVTQSAMSHALRRLREMIGDPLLIRGRSGMVLTPRAEALVVPLRSGLVTLGRALAQPATFEPGTAQRAFRFASPDLFDVLAVPALLEHIREQAPGIDIAATSVEARRLGDQLETGELDVAVIAQMDEARPARATESAPGLVRQLLFRDRFTCLMRADHAALRSGRGSRRATAGALSLAAYAALSHVLVSTGGDGLSVVDRVLEQHGMARRIALRVPYFYSALAIVAKSDLVLTAPTALTRLAPPSEVAVIAPPPPLRALRHGIHLVWHERFAQDPGHRWIRGLIAQAARALRVGVEP